MGNQLDRPTTSNILSRETIVGIAPSADMQAEIERRVQAVVPWLDQMTATLLAEIVAVVVAKHSAVAAAILFGSVARHEERPLDDPHPSDVDLLLLVTPDPVRQRLPYAQQLALWESIGEIQYRHCDAPREVEVTLVESTLADWDELFVTNVARDGRLLWLRDPSDSNATDEESHARDAANHSKHLLHESSRRAHATTDEALRPLPSAWQHLAEGR